MDNKYDKSLAYWELSIRFLHLAHCILEEMIRHGNRWIIVIDPNLDKDIDDFEVYDELTKWSDFNLIEPVLFSFYHGLELLLKGFVLFKSQDTKLNHNIEKLLENFSTLYPHEKDLSSLLGKYIDSNLHPQPLKEFFQDNNGTSNDFNELFRYPSNKSMSKFFSCGRLHYQEFKILDFVSEMRDDINEIRNKAVILGRSLESQH